ncbi:hypothetical protein GCM10010211_61980 [Streptomyces albospinus]|uniref:DUF2218 domain-containing protein n=1 Tax=Streptomyces albospinus TaxID=285515 RepID=A0ABQ2VHU5_9ACTN|nr:DUF2218 domain-containing protein [Streptomyces albospinus]GGU87329.1 hypothetical protein GCM10010211_61980 [Streptomyces albospinus]
MPTAEARIATDRASRYLVQLCGHLNTMGGMRHHNPGHPGEGHTPPTVEHVDWSDTYGTARFSTGLCTLLATAEALTLRVDTDDEATLQRLQRGISHRIEKIGRRDQLTTTWRRTDAPTPAAGEAAGTESASPPAAGRRRRRGWLSTLGLAALAALFILAHLGLLGGVFAVAGLEKWGIGVVVALIAVKVIIGGLHVLRGGVALRRGKARSVSWHRSRRRAHHPAPPAEQAAGLMGNREHEEQT